VKLTNAQRLPCGCVIGDGPGDAFVMQPCSPTCEYYRYFLAESARQGKPISYVPDVVEGPLAVDDGAAADGSVGDV
jgi:hypothetical protein